MTIEVSIITPSYNQGLFIERTLQSVLTQCHPSLEYLVVDGGSTDQTLTYLKKYEPRLRWISESDKGQADAVNKGFRLTTGHIIGWLNSDDIYYPDAILKVQDYFKAHPEVDVVYGQANHINADDQIIEPYYTEQWDLERLKEVCYLSQPAVFFRRRVIERYGLLNDKLQYCMDYEYWLRLAKNGAKFAFIPELLAGSRLHDNTKTLSAAVKVHKEINDMLKNTFKVTPDRWLSNYAHVYVRSHYPKHFYPNRLQRAIALQTILAAFRWNKKISLSLLFTTFQWFCHSFKPYRENLS